MTWKSHWVLKDRKEDVLEDIEEWVGARLPTLARANMHDLTILMLATREHKALQKDAP